MTDRVGILDLFAGASWRSVVACLFGAWCAYYVVVGIYRIYFHPLARFPGPKLAALTFWYEFYYDVFPHRFQYLWKIKQLHEQYGPIIRINPIHIHIHDHTYFDTIYASGTAHKRNRCAWMHHTGAKTMAGSMLEAMDHDLHKSRRSAVANFFSKRSVQALEPLVVSTVEQLILRLKSESGEKIVNLNNAYAAMTMDIISAYCFGSSMASITRPEYGKEWLDMLHSGIQMRPLGRQFPWLINTMLDIPPHIMARVNTDMARIVTWTHQMLPKIEAILAGDGVPDENKPRQVSRTIFHEIRDAKLSPEEKHPMRLVGESHVFLGAGTETTARTLAVTTFYLMKHRDIGDKLREELKTVLLQPDSIVSLAQLEALPYLSAVISEGLRVAHGVSQRQPRIATEEELVYKQWVIPRGTPCMQSAYLLHMDPNVYPDPFAFKPQRWLDNPELKKYWFAFSRGSRSCLGMNLAISELYFAIAMVWRRLDLEIYDTLEERDVLTTHDCFIGMPDLKSEGIKVKIVEELTT
ncbi:benzoate 4-monooxygenase cytochrome P450 [Paraphoma chrysanthemicola]|uniref:Benzoate 4-monooxygenase cytochrome P450 n=1 Tax=Paraphoma chrysanthemicola TaxID=798071 RepID=A0A8K0RGK6_9PLEO|nr:benzoate 4-monooxygenase cytochrome P450 [Paraphoma chrysanthemicola]